MSKLKIILVIAVLHLYFSSANALGLNSVYSKDGNEVWAVGVIGNVIHSTNGGASWADASFGGLTYNSVYSGGQFVWIVSNTGVEEITTDNGYSWNQYTVSAGLSLNSVFFINSTTGWIAGNNGSIFKSTNSGLNWTAQTSNTTNNLSCIAFTDSLNGAACGANGAVLLTTNGGSSWSLSNVTSNNSLTSLDIKTGIIIVCGVDRTVIKTTNNGALWSAVDYRMQTRVDINSVSIIDPNTYYSCGSDGFIRKSTDGGATFIFEINPMLSDLYKIYFYDGNKGWACGRDNNVVLRTTDGGNTWQMPAATTQSFVWQLRFTTDPEGTWGSIFSLSGQNPNEVFVCANHHIYRSINPGQNWVSISNLDTWGNAPHCLVVSPNDSNKMLAAYDSLQSQPPYAYHGRIYRTSDYGNTWSITFAQDLDVDSNPIGVDPDHPDTVYLGTTDSLVYRSTNFGLNWTATGPSRLGKMCSIAIVKGHSNIILIGSSNDTNSASVYRSTDYGATWGVVYTSTGSDFPELPCITYSIYNPDKLYFASFFGNPHGMYVSTNDGLNWVQSYPDANVWGISIAKDDPNVIFWGYGGGTPAYYTINGGTNWNSTILPSTNNQSFLCFNRKIVLTQQNHGIYQLVATYNYPIGIQPISNEVPKQFSLSQNYPNPFNPSTKFKFEIAKSANVKVIVYDVIGREVAILVNEQLKPGVYEVNWDASNFPSGVYFYKLVVGENTNNGGFAESKKMILIK